MPIRLSRQFSESACDIDRDAVESRRHASRRWRELAVPIVTVAMALRMLTAIGQDSFPDDLSHWIATDVPAVTMSDFGDEWFVFLQNGRPSVRDFKSGEDDCDKLPFKIEEGNPFEGFGGWVHAARVTDGWIVGFNRGEFGGSLWWFAADGKSRYLISRDRIRAFLATGPELLAFEGLAHLTNDRGGIMRLKRGEGGKWSFDRIADLRTAPQAAARDKDGSLVVVGTKRLLRVRIGKPVEVLMDNAFWQSLSPTSVIIDGSGAIYIGMQYGVAKVTQAGGKSKVAWLRPRP